MNSGRRISIVLHDLFIKEKYELDGSLIVRTIYTLLCRVNFKYPLKENSRNVLYEFSCNDVYRLKIRCNLSCMKHGDTLDEGFNYTQGFLPATRLRENIYNLITVKIFSGKSISDDRSTFQRSIGDS